MPSFLLRPAVAVLLAASVVAGGAAVAAPKAKPACNLFTDVAGDGTGFVLTDQNYLPNDPQLDVLSGDVASDGKTLTAVLRLSALDKTDTNAPTGRTYYVNFGIGDVELNLSAALDQDGVATYQAGFQDTAGRSGLGEVTGVLDTAKKEVRIHAPLSVFAEKLPLKAGTKLEYVEGLAQRYAGAVALSGTMAACAFSSPAEPGSSVPTSSAGRGPTGRTSRSSSSTR